MEKQTFIGWLEEKIFDPIGKFVSSHYDNPFMWVGIVLIVLIIFSLGYNSLNKDQ